MDTGITRTLHSHKYGSFSSEQIEQAQRGLRKKIFFLLLIVDPENKAEYEQRNYDIQEAFESLMLLMDGLKHVFNNPGCLVIAIGMLEEAMIIFRNSNGGFTTRADENFKQYKRLVLGAGNEILKLEGGDLNA